jgi:hypothetical protein
MGLVNSTFLLNKDLYTNDEVNIETLLLYIKDDPSLDQSVPIFLNSLVLLTIEGKLIKYFGDNNVRKI